jgi:hypothetical protein
MDIQIAQREIRDHFAGGFYGQLVSAALWITAASLGTWSTHRAAIITVVIGGFFIFPVTTLFIRFSGRTPKVSAGNPLTMLGMQIAFVLPCSMPVLLGVARYRIEWFFPALTILVGAHYFPFVFLYGMRLFAALAALMVGGGMAIVMLGIAGFSAAAWYAAGVLAVFAIAGRVIVARESDDGRVPQA